MRSRREHAARRSDGVALASGSSAGRLIRPMTLADCERVGTIHTIGWQAGYRGILPDAFLDGLSVQDRIERRRHAVLNPRPGPQKC